MTDGKKIAGKGLNQALSVKLTLILHVLFEFFIHRIPNISM